MSFDNPNFSNDLSPLRPNALKKKIAKGSHADIYEVGHDQDLILKIGETQKYSPPILKALGLSFHRETVSKLLEKVLGPEFKINLDIDFIKNGIAEYYFIKQYVGTDEKNSEENKKTERKHLFSDLYNENSNFHKELLNILKSPKLLKKVENVLRKHQEDNFLPQEQVVIGHPPDLNQQHAEHLKSIGKKLPTTYYLFQKQITGKDVVPLKDLNENDLKANNEILERLLTFAILAKKMYFDTGKLIDMRPEEIGKHPLEWFQETSNLLVDKSTGQIWFVDTRWLWDKKSILGEKGLNLIDWLGIKSVNKVIKKYAAML